MKRRSFLERSLRVCGLAAGMAGGLAAGFAGPAQARRVFPEDGELDYLGLRQGDQAQVVGRRRVRFSRASGDFVARIDVSLQLGPAAPRYRFEQHSEEVWRDGWLHAVTCDTDDDGALWRVRAERQEGIFGGAVNDLGFTVSGYPITSTLWHRDVPSQQALLDVTDARVKLIRGQLLGEETVAAAGAAINAKRYSIRGEINHDLWYDEDCSLVRFSQPLRDGSLIVFEAQ